jgi:pumilio RNA-binding family
MAAQQPNASGSGSPDWAVDGSLSGANRNTWAPEFTLPARPASGPISRERHSLAFELRSAARREQQQRVMGDSTANDDASVSTSTATASKLDGGGFEEDPLADSFEPSEAYRYEKQYHDWYYAQHPRDPRVPPPLGNPAVRNAAILREMTSADTPTSPPGAQQQQQQQQPPQQQQRPSVAHPLASLRKHSEAVKPGASSPLPLLPPGSSAESKPDNGTPPPLRSLGPVGPMAPSAIGGEGSGRGNLDTSVSLPAHHDPLAVPDDALEGSAAMWIDGLPMPTVDALGAGSRRAERRASRTSSGSKNSTGSKRKSRIQPSPLLRQYKDEAAQTAASRPASQPHRGITPPTNAASRGPSLGGSAIHKVPDADNDPLALPDEKPSTPTPSTQPAALTTLNVATTPTNAANGAASSTGAPKPFQQPYQPPRSLWDLTAVSGHIVEFACDQEGSRLIQSLAEDSFSLSAIFCEVHDSLPMLVSHQFGNYCAQRLLELGQPTHKLAVMGALKGRMVQLAMDTYGCRVIQRALDTFTDETVDEMVALAHELDRHIPELVIDQNGNHVVQKLMDRLPPHRYGTTALVTSFIGRMQDIGMHSYGCRVIQKLFECCGDGARFAEEAPGSKYLQQAIAAMQALVQDVVSHVHALVVDQFGNYVIQHLIANGSRETRAKAIGALTPRVPELAMLKFSSNVVERLLACATDGERDNIVAVLSSVRTFSAEPVPPIVELTRDKYANYVVQRLIELATPTQKTSLVNAISPYMNEIRTTTFGVHILSRLERIGWLPAGASGVSAPITGRGRGMRNGRGRGGIGGGRGNYGDGPGGQGQGGHQGHAGGLPHHHHQHHQPLHQQQQQHMAPHLAYGHDFGGGSAMGHHHHQQQHHFSQAAHLQHHHHHHHHHAFAAQVGLPGAPSYGFNPAAQQYVNVPQQYNPQAAYGAPNASSAPTVNPYANPYYPPQQQQQQQPQQQYANGASQQHHGGGAPQGQQQAQQHQPQVGSAHMPLYAQQYASLAQQQASGMYTGGSPVDMPGVAQPPNVFAQNLVQHQQHAQHQHHQQQHSYQVPPTMLPQHLSAAQSWNAPTGQQQQQMQQQSPNAPSTSSVLDAAARLTASERQTLFNALLQLNIGPGSGGPGAAGPDTQQSPNQAALNFSALAAMQSDGTQGQARHHHDPYKRRGQ